MKYAAAAILLGLAGMGFIVATELHARQAARQLQAVRLRLAHETTTQLAMDYEHCYPAMQWPPHPFPTRTPSGFCAEVERETEARPMQGMVIQPRVPAAVPTRGKR
jgi:hypothetical protein